MGVGGGGAGGGAGGGVGGGGVGGGGAGMYCAPATWTFTVAALATSTIQKRKTCLMGRVSLLGRRSRLWRTGACGMAHKVGTSAAVRSRYADPVRFSLGLHGLHSERALRVRP